MSKIARKIVLVAPFKGTPTLSNFKIVEETLPELKDGEILCKAEFLTVDPYMRGASGKLKPGDTLIGSQVARVLSSKHKDFPANSQVVGYFGWRDLTIYAPPESKAQRHFGTLYPLPEMKGLPDSYALGSMGMPGNTAFFGVSKVLEMSQGKTLVVSAAAGAVGSLVGQMGKINGCRVIGYAGTDDKVKWLKDLGFDYAFNYKKTKLAETLTQAAPNGVDYYFDNVGGEFTNEVIKKMNNLGRVALCGAISTYNRESTETPLVPMDYGNLIYKNIRIEGFVVTRWMSEWFNGLNQIRDWILEKKVAVNETVVDGFENMPTAFINLFTGENTGKMIIKV